MRRLGIALAGMVVLGMACVLAHWALIEVAPDGDAAMAVRLETLDAR